MAQAAEKTPVDGEMHEDEKMQDSDSRVHSAHGTRNEDASNSPMDLRPPHDIITIEQSTNTSPNTIATATADTTIHSSNNSFTQLASDSVKAA
jgi:hypothetical protein